MPVNLNCAILTGFKLNWLADRDRPTYGRRRFREGAATLHVVQAGNLAQNHGDSSMFLKIVKNSVHGCFRSAKSAGFVKSSDAYILQGVFRASTGVKIAENQKKCIFKTSTARNNSRAESTRYAQKGG
jgi:hypothetical protein